MTDQRANGNSFSQKEIDSPLTMGDLIAVLDSIFGQDISNRVMVTATELSSNGPTGDLRTAIKQVLAKTAVVDTQAPLAEIEANKGTNNGTQDTGTPPSAVTETLPAALTETQPLLVAAVTETLPAAVNIQVADTQPASALQADSTPATRWYAVTVGKEVGVFTNWNVVAPFVVSVSGACYPRYSSRQAAEAAFQRAIENGSVRRIV